MVHHGDRVHLWMLPERQPELFRIGPRPPLQLKLGDPEAVEPHHIGNPLPVDPVVDDQDPLPMGNRGEDRRLDRSRTRSRQDDRRIFGLGPRHERLQEFLTDAAQQVHELGFAMADIRTVQRLPHPFGHVDGTGIQQNHQRLGHRAMGERR
ncbi:MAG: hypothetical protein KatS3mg082_2177 [Nitrospiraceae bacterium]|nr:MAG: hypothetical protein KatS3mg082_2177 [Nitrospiraceae bacterium]